MKGIWIEEKKNVILIQINHLSINSSVITRKDLTVELALEIKFRGTIIDNIMLQCKDSSEIYN